MSIDISALINCEFSPLINETRQLCREARLSFSVVRKWSNWSDYRLVSDNEFRCSDVILTWLLDDDFCESMQTALLHCDTDVIKSHLSENRCGAIQIELTQAERGISRYKFIPLGGNGTLNGYSIDCLSQAFAIQCNGSIDIHGEVIKQCSKHIETMTSLLFLKSTIGVRSEEELARSIEREMLIWHETTDAQITDKTCPQCNRPMPGYRRVCRFCGYERGTLY